jgi:thioredoxin reductase
VGLAAAFWAGMREASSRIIDSLPELGGQLTTLYPEKWIFDVPGHPKILAKDLVELHRQQTLEQFDVPVHLETTADSISWEDDLVVLHTDRGDLRSRTVVVAGGHGAFEPKKLPDYDMTAWEGRGAHYLVGSKSEFEGKRVVIIGGGDTGADCLGTSHRQKAASVHQFEILPMPPDDRSPSTPWPLWPLQLRSESSHEEGGKREWAVATTHFSGDDGGNVRRLHGVRVGPAPKFEAIPGTEFTMDVDLVLLAMGFTGAERPGLLAGLGVDFDQRGNVARDGSYATSVPGVFAAGDMGRGQSLIVWAIAEGRSAAAAVDRYLGGQAGLQAPIPPTARPLT